jgi:putative transposase
MTGFEHSKDPPPQRKHPAHGVKFVEGQPTIIFDTVCTKDRVQWLANDLVHELLIQVWREATAWLVGRYVVMPDHLHFFAQATESEIPYDNWVKYWKSQFTQRHKVAEHRWQTDDWDVRMRNATQYEEKWLYVVQNPVRGGLVTQADDWPYRGEVHELRWS